MLVLRPNQVIARDMHGARPPSPSQVDSGRKQPATVTWHVGGSQSPRYATLEALTQERRV